MYCTYILNYLNFIFMSLYCIVFYFILFYFSFTVMFDLCGICCGHFLMPFQNFFIPLVLGKAIVKTIIQSFFLIFVFSNNYKELQLKIIQKCLSILPLHLFSENLSDESFLESYIDEKISILKHGKKSSSKLNFMFLFNIFFCVLLIVFFISCINQIAQKYQKVSLKY